MEGKSWRTREGVNIPIKEMNDDHLINTLNMIRYNHDTRMCRLINRGDEDLAGYFTEQILNNSTYKALLAEAERRNLLE